MTTALVPEIGQDDEGRGMALSRVRPIALLRPIAQPGELLTQQEETRALITGILKKGRDYGEIPGVEKPSLLKPGAERICIAFGTFPRFRILSQEIDHDREVTWVKKRKEFEGKGRDRTFKGWKQEEGVSRGLYRYVVECEIVARELGIVVGSCVGSCSTMESKYVDRPHESENTVLQMAEKRAHVAATRITFGLSDQFTQDVEDAPEMAHNSGVEDTGHGPAPLCPQCKGPMHDNRDKNLERVAEGKKRMPDFKCKSSTCKDAKGETPVIWHAPEHPSPPPAESGIELDDAEDQRMQTLLEMAAEGMEVDPQLSAAQDAAELEALAEIRQLMEHGLTPIQVKYVEEKLGEGADPVALLAAMRQKIGYVPVTREPGE